MNKSSLSTLLIQTWKKPNKTKPEKIHKVKQTTKHKAFRTILIMSHSFRQANLLLYFVNLTVSSLEHESSTLHACTPWLWLGLSPALLDNQACVLENT